MLDIILLSNESVTIQSTNKLVFGQYWIYGSLIDIAETTRALWTANNLQRQSKVLLTTEVQLATNHIDNNNGYMDELPTCQIIWWDKTLVL